MMSKEQRNFPYTAFKEVMTAIDLGLDGLTGEVHALAWVITDALFILEKLLTSDDSEV